MGSEDDGRRVELRDGLCFERRCEDREQSYGNGTQGDDIGSRIAGGLRNEPRAIGVEYRLKMSCRQRRLASDW